jgi:hypothetical protein
LKFQILLLTVALAASPVPLVLKQGIGQNPDSRHLRMVYAGLLWYLSGEGRDRTLLDQAAEQAVKAMEIGLGLRIVDQQLVALLSDVLSRTEEVENLERLFSRACLRFKT